jgi:hypothetical protein
MFKFNKYRAEVVHTWVLRLFVFSLLLAPYNSWAQKDKFLKFESQLNKLADKLYNSKSEAKRLEYNQEFIELWDFVIDDPKSMKHTFTSITSFPILTSSDKKLRIINWMVPLDDSRFQYHAIVQYYDLNKTYQATYLEPITEEMPNLEFVKLKDNKWLGALYYQMEKIKRGKKNHYILLGWDGNNERSNKKIIDVLTIGKELTFGEPLFRKKKERFHRYILEYQEGAAASIKFKVKEKRIIFSNLIPTDPDLEGLYDYYVPDGSMNAFELNNGSFRFKENVKNLDKVKVPRNRKIKLGLTPNN